MTVYRRVLYSNSGGMRVARVILLGCLILLAMATIRTIVVSAVPPLQYHHDLLQEYLLGKAVLAKVDPYLPLPELMTLFFPEADVSALPHSTPHPPPVVLLGLPLALLPYSTASFLWTVLELLSVVGVWFMMSRWFGIRLRPCRLLLAAFLILGWVPFLQELAYRQLMIVLLALLLGAGLMEHRHKPYAAGILLGIALSLKLLGWPILMWWAIRRKWTAVWAAMVTIGTLNALAALILHPRVVVRYYFATAQNVTPHYQAFAFNFSPWTVGWRLFSGTGSSVLMSITAPPLFHAPQIAPIASLAIVAALFVALMTIVLRTDDPLVSYPMLLCLSILLSPVTWIHYFTWVLPALVILGKRLFESALPPLPTSTGLLIVLVLGLPAHLITQAVLALHNDPLSSELQVSFWAASLTLLQPLAVVSLLALMRRVDGIYRPTRSSLGGLFADEHQEQKTE